MTANQGCLNHERLDKSELVPTFCPLDAATLVPSSTVETLSGPIVQRTSCAVSRGAPQTFRLSTKVSSTSLRSMSITPRAVVLGLIFFAGCANTSGDTLATCDPLTSPPASAAPPSRAGTVFTIVMENKSRHEILDNSKAPYINQLAKQGAVAMGYHDSYVHPSEPNYIWMVAGQN